MPDWIAQRLWLGSISLAAVLGARWLFRMLGTSRAGAIGGALVYMLTPYQLAFTARISVLLLAWAGLPWLVGLTMRAVRRGGWRDPALFALVILTIGSVNASSLRVRRHRSGAVAGPRRAVAVATAFGRVLRAVGAHRGPDRRRLALVDRRPAPPGLLRPPDPAAHRDRAHGRRRLDPRRHAPRHRQLVLLRRGSARLLDRSGLGLRQQPRRAGRELRHSGRRARARPRCVRWRHRAYFVLLVVVGTVVSVGAWPYDDPSPYGRLFKWFAGDTAAGLALRNTPRAVPLLVLGLAGLVAAGVAALAPRLGGLWPTVVVGVLACLAFVPVWRNGYLSRTSTAPKTFPRTGRTRSPRCSARATRRACSRSPGATSPRTAGATPSNRSRRA